MIILHALTLFAMTALAILFLFNGRVNALMGNLPLSTVFYSLTVVAIAAPVVWLASPIYSLALMAVAIIGGILAWRSKT